MTEEQGKAIVEKARAVRELLEAIKDARVVYETFIGVGIGETHKGTKVTILNGTRLSEDITLYDCTGAARDFVFRMEIESSIAGYLARRLQKLEQKLAEMEP